MNGCLMSYLKKRIQLNMEVDLWNGIIIRLDGIFDELVHCGYRSRFLPPT